MYIFFSLNPLIAIYRVFRLSDSRQRKHWDILIISIIMTFGTWRDGTVVLILWVLKFDFYHSHKFGQNFVYFQVVEIC